MGLLLEYAQSAGLTLGRRLYIQPSLFPMILESQKLQHMNYVELRIRLCSHTCCCYLQKIKPENTRGFVLFAFFFFALFA